MISSVVGVLAAAVISVAGFFRSRSKRERDLALQEFELLEKAEAGSVTEANLRALLEARTRRWLNGVGTVARLLRQAVIQLVGGGLLGVGGGIAQPFVPQRFHLAVATLVSLGFSVAVVGLVLAVIAVVQDLRGKWN